jgi:transcriptional regulator with XRE-family HTH domain
MPKTRLAMPVKARVRIYCAQRQITQAQLAKELSVTPSHLCQIVGGRQSTSLRLASALEHFTGVPAREFLRSR